MEQTFNDLYHERQRQTKRGLFGFVIWMFAETAIGIVKEYVLLIKPGDTMKTISLNLILPAIISFALVLPFMILELVNRREFHESFPIQLFVIMWLLPVAFILILMPIVRNVRTGNSLMAHPVILVIRVVFLVFIAIMWTRTVIDQMPCFMGVPFCD
jgi:hypothetical protein